MLTVKWATSKWQACATVRRDGGPLSGVARADAPALPTPAGPLALAITVKCLAKPWRGHQFESPTALGFMTPMRYPSQMLLDAYRISAAPREHTRPGGASDR